MFLFEDPPFLADRMHSTALAYCVPVLPTSMSRWIELIHAGDAPFGNMTGQFTFNSVFNLSGVIDVIVFCLVRQQLLLFDSPLDCDEMPCVNDGADRADFENDNQNITASDSAGQDIPLFSRSCLRGKYFESFFRHPSHPSL
jgi:hypothetical protein